MSSPAPATLAPDAKSTLMAALTAGSDPSELLSGSTLACIGFGTGPDLSDDPRFIHAGLPVLGGSPPFEVWRSAQRVDWDRDEGIGFAHDGTVLFGSLYLLECELDHMAAATYQAYARITTFLTRQGYPSLLRFWNFLHDINRGSSDRERYRQFCIGRHQALASAPGFERQLPAGTAIGMQAPGLLVYFLAGKEAGTHIENPRQMPAYRYPRQYGPRSPSFSRATFRRWREGAHLLVSGTASVVGHATQHSGDVGAQLDETLENLNALLAHAAASECPGACWIPQGLKLYLRDRGLLPMVRKRIQAAFGTDTPVLYLEGDICRNDLLLEIEGAFAAQLQ
jgi:chorismate lyase / 3-hydroxybenzoate synthase